MDNISIFVEHIVLWEFGERDETNGMSKKMLQMIVSAMGGGEIKQDREDRKARVGCCYFKQGGQRSSGKGNGRQQCTGQMGFQLQRLMWTQMQRCRCR